MKMMGALTGVVLLNGLSPLMDKSKYSIVDMTFLLLGFVMFGYLIGCIAEGLRSK